MRRHERTSSRQSARADDAAMLPQTVPPVDGHDDVRDGYLQGRKHVALALAVCIIFMAVGLDSSIVAVLVPTLTDDFRSASDVGWYLSIYRLMAGAFQPLFGKLYSLLPTKVGILTSLVIFLVSAVICATAPSSPVFILGRAIAGMGTAGVTSGAFAIIIESRPLKSRSKYAGVGAGIEALATLAAPLIGGALVDRLSWHWCFYLELPILFAAAFILFLYLDLPADTSFDSLSLQQLRKAINLPSTVTFVMAFSSLILALQWGGSRYPWSAWQVILPLVLSVSFLFGFVWLQVHLGDSAVIPVRILTRRTMLFGFLFAMCNNGGLSVIEYYMPTYFQVVQQSTATESGALVLPIGLGLVISVAVAGFLTPRLRYPNPLMLLNGMMMPVATGLLTTIKAQPSVWKLLIYEALLGIGVGIGFQGSQVAAQAVLCDDHDAKIGIAVIQVAQALGPAVFVATGQTSLANNLAADSSLDHHATYSEALGSMFILPLGAACVVFLAATGMEWRSVAP